MEKARVFSEFETFYALYKPLTVYGRAEKEKRRFFTDKSELENELDFIDAVKSLVAVKAVKDKLRHHLRNIPLVKADNPIESSAAELFLVRKFLMNVKAIFEILPESTRNIFGAVWGSSALLALLDKGGRGEAFFIADCYSERLADKRREILAADIKLKKLKEKRLRDISSRYGFDFSDRDFLIILDKNFAAFGEQHDLYAEPHDFGRLMVKPVYGNEYLSLAAERERLRAEEAVLEKKVVDQLIYAVNADRENLRLYIEAVRRIDTAVEKARLAIDMDMTRPEINDAMPEISETGDTGCTIELKNARFIPLEKALQKTELKYMPFSASFAGRINILHGSNMGGKTVALKTFVFFQLIVQSGFYVPAEYCRVSLFNEICFIGGDGAASAGGLSSFGIEMNDFIKACGKLEKGPTLFIMDEFARTTNSEEGTALLSAILGWLSQRSGAFVFLATHLAGLEAPENSSWFCMKGFDRTAFGTYFEEHSSADLEEKLRRINRFMCYEMLPVSSESESRDAVKIAGILGVDKEIINHAGKIIAARKK